MISVVIEKNNRAIAYDNKNRQIVSKPLNGGNLLGYTSSSFSIKVGSKIYTYDEKGRQISSKLV